MKILIVAATWMEVKLLVDEFIFLGEKNHMLKHYSFGGTKIDILITGIGATFTAFHLTDTLKENKYKIKINIKLLCGHKDKYI